MSKKFATLDSFRKKENERSSGEESDEDRQGFYVGGSERSGQQVLGPRRDIDIVTNLFDSARRAGAEQISPEEAAAQASGSRNRRSESGSGGYVLGGHGMPTQTIEKTQNSDDSDIEEIQQQPIRMTMFVWADGFSIDDGPLRDFNNPESRRFLQQITQGRVPEEIVRAHPGKKVDFHMERKSTPYVKPKLKPFSGEGQRLGAVVPSVVGAGSLPSSSAAKPVDPLEAETLLKEAQLGVSLNESEPTTRVQIRLPNGCTLVGSFNHDHSVDAVRSFIVSAVPDLAFQPFQLMTTFPNKIIDDESLSLKDARLLNTLVVVKPIGSY